MSSDIPKEIVAAGEVDEEQRATRIRSVVAAVLALVLIAGIVALARGWGSNRGQVGHREPLQGFSYCTPERPRPCVLAFRLDSEGRMAIDLLVDRAFPTDFYIQVRRRDHLSTYDCRMPAAFAANMSCAGTALPAGETLQFLVRSRRDDRLLAEGQFPIIGLALATPQPALTPTYVPLFDRPPR